MRILQINAVYGKYSTGRTCAEFQQFISDHGHECFSAYGQDKVNFKDTIYVGNFLDHKIHALLSRISGKVGYYSFFSTLKLIKYIEKQKIDLVHLRVLHSNFLNIPFLLSFLGKKNIATVVTLHDCFWFTGKCCHYVDVQCNKWKSECNNCPSYKMWNKSWFFDRSNKMFKDKKLLFSKINRLSIVGVSNWISNEARESAIFHDRDIHTVYNGIDLQVFYPRKTSLKNKLGIEDKKMILGVASDWNDEKGLNDFVQLSQILSSNEYNILMIGNMPLSMNLPENIIHINRTENSEDLADYYASADVFLQLSRQETFGKVTAEALACGTPVITYRNTANAEMAFDGCGLCVGKTGDINAVVEAIKEIIKIPNDSIIKSCRAVAEKLFDKEKNCQEYLKLYQELVNGGGIH